MRIKEYISEKWKNVNDRHKKLAVLGLSCFGLANLAYSLFSIYTILSFILFICGITVYAKLNLDSIFSKGLISYLPSKLQKTLISRSVFDVLCDIWFIPKISLYIKAIALPFFYKIQPEDAIHQLDHLHPKVRRAFLTKGIVNLFPQKIKESLLPIQPKVEDDNGEEFATTSEDEKAFDWNETRCNKINQNIFPSLIEDALDQRIGQIVLNEPKASNVSTIIQLDKIKDDDSSSGKEKNIHLISTDDDTLKMKVEKFNDKSLSRQLSISSPSPTSANDINTSPSKFDLPIFLEDKSFGLLNDFSMSPMKGKQIKSRRIAKFEKKSPASISSMLDIRSKVINSSNIMKKQSLRNQIQISEKWDKLELFTKKKRENLNNLVNVHKFHLEGPFKVLESIAGWLSKDAILKKLDNKKLIKVFIASTLILITQFSISKRTRHWLYNTIHLLMYIAGFVLSSGSLGIVITKYLAQRKANKQKKILQNKNIRPKA